MGEEEFIEQARAWHSLGIAICPSLLQQRIVGHQVSPCLRVLEHRDRRESGQDWSRQSIEPAPGHRISYQDPCQMPGKKTNKKHTVRIPARSQINHFAKKWRVKNQIFRLTLKVRSHVHTRRKTWTLSVEKFLLFFFFFFQVYRRFGGGDTRLPMPRDHASKAISYPPRPRGVYLAPLYSLVQALSFA